MPPIWVNYGTENSNVQKYVSVTIIKCHTVENAYVIIHFRHIHGRIRIFVGLIRDQLVYDLVIMFFSSILQKVLEFTGWPEDSQKAREVHEVHECFFHTMIEKVGTKNAGMCYLLYRLDLVLWNTCMPLHET